jgi:hypothetical protein
MAVTAATVHETKPVLMMLDKIRVRRRRGRPQQRPAYLIADRGYDSMPLRRALRQRNIQPIIPRREWAGWRRRKGRLPGSSTVGRYQGRWKIKRLNAGMDIYRRVAVCWDRTQTAFTAWVTLACALICLELISKTFDS